MGCLAVVGIVIPCGKGIGPEDNPALHLGTESFRPGAFVHFHETVIIFVPVSILDTVIPGQVRAGFRRCDDIIGCHPIFCVRQRDFNGFGAQGFDVFNRSFNRMGDVRVNPLGRAVFLGDTDDHAF